MPGRPTTERSDEELACQAQQGCAQSFEELVHRFQVPLLRFLRRLGAGADAEDLLQDTFVRAYDNLHRYKPRWRFSPWLFTIARRLHINHHRRPRPGAAGNELQWIESRVPGPADEVSEAEQRQRLWAAAAHVLSEEEMAAVWLFYVQELSGREIAGVLARSWVSVKTMLFRARRKLLAAFQELECDRAPCAAETPSRREPGGKLAEAEVRHA